MIQFLSPTLSSSSSSSTTNFHQKIKNKISSNNIRCCCSDESILSLPAENDNLSSFPEKNIARNPVLLKPPRPRRIILVRHGQSEGNLDESVYTRVADPKVGITAKGAAEAEECGRKLRDLIEKDDEAADDWKVYFYVSPYRRGLETLRNLAKVFGRSRIAGVREEPRLREQDFGKTF